MQASRLTRLSPMSRYAHTPTGLWVRLIILLKVIFLFNPFSFGIPSIFAPTSRCLFIFCPGAGRGLNGQTSICWFCIYFIGVLCKRKTSHLQTHKHLKISFPKCYKRQSQKVQLAMTMLSSEFVFSKRALLKYAYMSMCIHM